MNLNNNPTQEQLSELFAECNDNEGHHIIWVNNDGTVKIALLIDTIPAKWAVDQKDICKFRLETCGAGNGYTGKEATKDPNWINRIFELITFHWDKGTKGYVDIF
jgi:hypothetical protein